LTQKNIDYTIKNNYYITKYIIIMKDRNQRKVDEMNGIKIFLAIFLGTIVLPCNAPLAVTQIKLESAFPNLTFTRPVDFQHPGDGSNRLFVIEQRGVIDVFENSQDTVAKIYLDIIGHVDSESGDEMGLLGLAFHPDFKTNGYFFVYYTAQNPMRSVISRFSVNKNNPENADPSSEFVILEIPQPYIDHKAGQLVFGPDGYLYIGSGDGGGGGDPDGNAQNRFVLLGKILRIDVDHPGASARYGIPADNPFAGNKFGYKEEIYAYGLRNPWRFSIDPITKQLWAGDVGQDRYEEVDIIQKGGNYGWNIMEGMHCYNSSGCDTTGLNMPVIEYSHSLQGNAVIGGFIYRGKLAPELYGTYIYADYVEGKIWKLTYSPGKAPINELILQLKYYISSFGVDSDNELYLCVFDGKIYRFTSNATKADDWEPEPAAIAILNNYPNPFNPSTTIEFKLTSPGKITLILYDVMGHIVREMVSGNVSGGVHTIRWDGKDDSGRAVSSGIYISKLTAGKYTAVQKMLLMK
jgi:glucose/arabinose dehydrogenase